MATTSAVITLAAAEAFNATSPICYIDNDGNNLISTNDLIWISGTPAGYPIVAGDVLRLADTSGNTIGFVSF